MIAPVLVAGLVALGIAVVVEAVRLIAQLTAARNDANKNFSTCPVGSPSSTCPLSNPKPKWTPAQIKEMLDKCDGGTGVWSAAKAANGGKDPVVKSGAMPGGGQVNLRSGEITLDDNLDPCFAVQIQIQELCNLSHKSDMTGASDAAARGEMSRDAYIRSIEEAEYDGVKKVIQGFDACKDKWGCKTCEKEWARQYKSFDDYYNKALSNDHKEHYGKFWDDHYKSAYTAKHP